MTRDGEAWDVVILEGKIDVFDGYFFEKDSTVPFRTRSTDTVLLILGRHLFLPINLTLGC
jgi:hypothetical protein